MPVREANGDREPEGLRAEEGEARPLAEPEPDPLGEGVEDRVAPSLPDAVRNEEGVPLGEGERVELGRTCGGPAPPQPAGGATA